MCIQSMKLLIFLTQNRETSIKRKSVTDSCIVQYTAYSTLSSIQRLLLILTLTEKRNVFDQFMKHQVKAKYYIRYADDFVIFSQDKEWLERVLLQIQDFLEFRLCLGLHPDKVFIKTLASGVDFLGWKHFPHHRVLRTTTKKRMWRNIEQKEGKKETVQSYLGMLSHGNGRKLQEQLKAEKINR